MSEAKKKVEKADPKKAVLPNESLFRVGQEVKVEGVLLVVKEVKGIDVIFSRKDYK